MTLVVIIGFCIAIIEVWFIYIGFTPTPFNNTIEELNKMYRMNIYEIFPFFISNFIGVVALSLVDEKLMGLNFGDYESCKVDLKSAIGYTLGSLSVVFSMIFLFVFIGNSLK